MEQSTFSLPPDRMISLADAVPNTLEEMELEEFFEYDIREIQVNVLYHVLFQKKDNGNDRFVVEVKFSNPIGDLSDDESWEEEVEVNVIERENISPLMCEMITELLAVTLDDEYFDSEDDESDDDTASLPSQPMTPPFRASRPLTPPPLPRRYR